MCEISVYVLGGMAKGHELIQQLLHRIIGSRTLSLSSIIYSQYYAGLFSLHTDQSKVDLLKEPNGIAVASSMISLHSHTEDVQDDKVHTTLCVYQYCIVVGMSNYSSDRENCDNWLAILVLSPFFWLSIIENCNNCVYRIARNFRQEKIFANFTTCSHW